MVQLMYRCRMGSQWLPGFGYTLACVTSPSQQLQLPLAAALTSSRAMHRHGKRGELKIYAQMASEWRIFYYFPRPCMGGLPPAGFALPPAAAWFLIPS